MKIKENFLLKKVADNYVVVPVGSACVDFNGMITLNETSAFLWEEMKEDVTEEYLVKRVLEVYDTDEQTAKKGVEMFINNAKEADLIEN